jgi:hypothetical protein
MILSSSLTHGNGASYHFRIHPAKLDSLCSNELKNLTNYLKGVMVECPNEYFLEGPRSSAMRHEIGADLKKIEHEVAFLARMGLESDYYNNAHLNVQMFMLSYDQKTIAIEVPLWMTKSEHDNYEELFHTELALSGHIDLVRIEDSKIWIWDFKPKAAKEKHASTQVFFYALMLSKRTNLSMKNFMCGYFDDKDVYVFDPSKIKIETLLRK